MAQKRQTWRNRLEPFATLYRNFVRQVRDQIEAMPLSDVRKLLESAEQPTETNCGWSTYQAAPIIRHMCKRRLYAAEQQAGKEK